MLYLYSFSQWGHICNSKTLSLLREKIILWQVNYCYISLGMLCSCAKTYQLQSGNHHNSTKMLLYIIWKSEECAPLGPAQKIQGNYQYFTINFCWLFPHKSVVHTNTKQPKRSFRWAALQDPKFINASCFSSSESAVSVSSHSARKSAQC